MSIAGTTQSRRGATLQAQVAGAMLLAVVSGLSISGAMIASQGTTADVDEQAIAELRQAWVTDAATNALDRALAELDLGGTGELAYDTYERSWFTQVTDYGAFLRVTATASTFGFEAECEALVERTAANVESAPGDDAAKGDDTKLVLVDRTEPQLRVLAVR